MFALIPSMLLIPLFIDSPSPPPPKKKRRRRRIRTTTNECIDQSLKYETNSEYEKHKDFFLEVNIDKIDQ